MPPLRQAFDVGRSFDAGGNYFSFATPTTRRSHGPDGEGGAEYGTLIQKVKGGYGYFSRSDGLRLNGGNRREWSMLDDGELKGLARSPGDEHLGDKSSPVLWEKGRSLRLVPIYPSSQPQIMAKYRQEMLELVRGVPESAYELSLRDLVEVPRVGMFPEEEDAGKERGGVPDSVITSLPQAQRSRGGVPEIVTGKDKKKKKKREEEKVKGGKKQILRSASMDSGVFLLKMFFPISLRGKRTFGGGAGSGSKVSPKPVLAGEDKGKPEKEADAEWPEGCGEMSRGGSGEIKNSGRRRKTIGCYPFSTNKGRIR